MLSENKKSKWFGISIEEDSSFVMFLVGMVVFLLLLAGVVSYFDRRIEDVEEQLSFVPPSRYEKPDLASHAANIDSNSFTERQLVYVPVYSHIYYGGGAAYSLETTLSLRNADQDDSVYFSKVDYYDTEGKKVESFLDGPIELKPLETIEFLVERRDSSGGSGANFLVEWLSEDKVDMPLIEAVMVGVTGPNGISFSRQGIEVSTPSNSGTDGNSE